jgi:hypothetical protein
MLRHYQIKVIIIEPSVYGICANLESVGIRCWIAPWDISPGEDWPAAISHTIAQCQVMVLFFHHNRIHPPMCVERESWLRITTWLSSN